MSTGAKRRTFTQWQRELDALIESKVGLDTTSLPHLDLRSAFRAGEAPATYFTATVKPELDDLGFNLDLLDGLEEAAAEGRQVRAQFMLAAGEAF